MWYTIHITHNLGHRSFRHVHIISLPFIFFTLAKALINKTRWVTQIEFKAGLFHLPYCVSSPISLKTAKSFLCNPFFQYVVCGKFLTDKSWYDSMIQGLHCCYQNVGHSVTSFLRKDFSATLIQRIRTEMKWVLLKHLSLKNNAAATIY